MVRQTGHCVFNSNGIIKKGTIVRHLVLPGHIKNAKNIINYLYNKYHDDIYLSIMNQYTPIKKTNYENLNHQLREKDYNEVIEYAINLGISNCYCQLDNTANKDFIPNFDLEGIKK